MMQVTAQGVKARHPVITLKSLEEIRGDNAAVNRVTPHSSVGPAAQAGFCSQSRSRDENRPISDGSRPGYPLGVAVLRLAGAAMNTGQQPSRKEQLSPRGFDGVTLRV